MNFQFDYKRVPFVRILIPYLSGILTVSAFPDYFSRIFLVLVLLTLLLAVLRFLAMGRQYVKTLTGIFLFNGFFICGLLSYSLAVQHHIFPDQEISVQAIVTNPPVIKENSVQADCLVMNYSYQGRTMAVKELVRMYISEEPYMKIPQTGDSISFVAKLNPLKNRGNPKEFNFVRYMRNEKIHYSGYVLYEHIQVGTQSEKFKLRRLASAIQKTIIRSFSEYSIKDNELAIISALAAGNRELLNNELKSKYAIAGAMHILAVSGLHVGILYLFLSFILWRRNQTRPIRIFRLVAIIFSIWFFALITGLSSSVVRASLMFSLFLLGDSFKRQSNSYNILAASAMIILVIDPLEFFKPGFQLSYLAVLGILYFQPRLVALLSFQNVVIDRIWQLITVSIAAQISILPLSLYYFHQFPVYFWLSNIFVIPLVWLIMVCTILFFLATGIGLLPEWISFALNALLKILNFIVEGVSSLPFAVISNIRFETIHLVVSTFVIFIVLISSVLKRISVIYLLGSGIVFLLLINAVCYNKNNNKKELLVYNYGNFTAISLIHGHNHLLLHNAKTDESENLLRWNQNFQISRQIDKNTENFNYSEISACFDLAGTDAKIETVNSGMDLQYCDKKIRLIERDHQSYNAKNNYASDHVNWLILGSNPLHPAQMTFTQSLPDKIIISRRVSKKIHQAWYKFANENKIEFIDVQEQGAFHIEMN